MEERIQSTTTGVRVRSILHRRFLPKVAPASGGVARPSAVFLAMCWFGLAAGLLELALVAAQRGLVARISLDSLRTNRHFPWMIPAADLAIFALCGVILGPLARRHPGLARLLSHFLGAGLLALAALLSVEWLHPLAAAVL